MAKKRPMAGAPSRSNLPSYLFLLACVLNTLTIVWLAQKLGTGPGTWAALVPLVALQAVLMIGLQEAKHQCVHRQFLVSTRLNDAVGVVAATVFGMNFVGYRSFHQEHHRHTCQADDPEGLLYEQSWHTRLIWLLGAIELIWVAFNTNRFSRRYVPASALLHWRLCNALIVIALLALALGMYWVPGPLLCAYVLPFCLFAWLEFPLTQAEHYGVPVMVGGRRRAPQDITTDVLLPSALSWLILHRSLHRTHHAAPATRWFQAQARSLELAGAQPGRTLDLVAFVKAWLRHGPRLWR